MAEQSMQALAQALGENSQLLLQNAQTTDQNSRVMTECAGRIAHSLEDFSFGDIDGHGPGTGKGEGKIPFNIKVFEGNPQEFENWIKQIEKHSFLFNCNDRKKQLVAYQTCTGLVSDYIKRYLESDGTEKTWANLKENLHSRFSPVLDRPRAFEQLVNIKQKKDEDVQFFAERLLSLSEKAYPDRTDSITPIIESRLLSIFLSGLSDPNVRAQIERTMPDSFEEAYQAALREQGILYRCATRDKARPDRLNRPRENNVDRRREQPMDIDHARHRNYNSNFNRGYRNREQGRTDRRTDSRNERQGLRCWGCNGPHKQKDCTNNLN